MATKSFDSVIKKMCSRKMTDPEAPLLGESFTATEAIAAAVIYVLYRFYKNREAMRYRHTEMLKKAKQHLAEEDERAPIASALYDNLRKTAAVFDVKPMTGETPKEYTHRLDMRFKVKNGDGTGGKLPGKHAHNGNKKICKRSCD